jgi:hypothetical protein
MAKTVPSGSLASRGSGWLEILTLRLDGHRKLMTRYRARRLRLEVVQVKVIEDT